MAVKTDCILYDKELERCRGLKALYCRKEDCAFYKTEKDEAIRKARCIEAEIVKAGDEDGNC